MGAVVLLVMMLYVLLAIGLVLLVRWITPKKLYRWLAVAFVILLPTWDAFLGFMIYYPACLFIPRVAIYETAVSESIYYEGANNYVYMFDISDRDMTEEELTNVGSLHEAIKRGFSFAEARVVEKYDDAFLSPQTRVRIMPTIYRCVPLPADSRRPDYQRTSCSVVSEAKSRYMVKVATIKLGPAQINFKKIIEISSGKLMAEYNRVALKDYYGIFLPFFSWLEWGGRRGIGYQCPGTEREYRDFEFNVLKPKH